MKNSKTIFITILFLSFICCSISNAAGDNYIEYSHDISRNPKMSIGNDYCYVEVLINNPVTKRAILRMRMARNSYFGDYVEDLIQVDLANRTFRVAKSGAYTIKGVFHQYFPHDKEFRPWENNLQYKDLLNAVAEGKNIEGINFWAY